jgi:hypothetical protein
MSTDGRGALASLSGPPKHALLSIHTASPLRPRVRLALRPAPRMPGPLWGEGPFGWLNGSPYPPLHAVIRVGLPPTSSGSGICARPIQHCWPQPSGTGPQWVVSDEMPVGRTTDLYALEERPQQSGPLINGCRRPFDTRRPSCDRQPSPRPSAGRDWLPAAGRQASSDRPLATAEPS